jgi:hypothetical protein
VKGGVHLITRVYHVLLAFYPSEFRTEFSQEMRDVFETALTEVQHRGWGASWWMFWREIRDWPGSVLREHLRVWRKKMFAKISIEEKPLSHYELLAAMIVFLLPLLIPLFSFMRTTGMVLPQWMDLFEQYLFWGPLILVLGFAIIKGLPRWSLSYLGFVLMVTIILSRYDQFFGWIYSYFTQSFGARSFWSLPIRIMYGGMFALIMLFSFLLMGLILVLLFRLIPHTRDVWKRIRTDWTRLSFLLYGGLVFGILIMFDEYHHEHIWLLLSLICLAIGAWLYLRAKNQKQRLLALLGGVTTAMWIVALAKWMLIPLQEWPTGYPVAPSETTRWLETGSAMIYWVFILIMLIAPALLNLLPQAPHPILSERESSLST